MTHSKPKSLLFFYEKYVQNLQKHRSRCHVCTITLIIFSRFTITLFIARMPTLQRHIGTPCCTHHQEWWFHPVCHGHHCIPIIINNFRPKQDSLTALIHGRTSITVCQSHSCWSTRWIALLDVCCTTNQLACYFGSSLRRNEINRQPAAHIFTLNTWVYKDPAQIL
jgi:hypothetical protein